MADAAFDRLDIPARWHYLMMVQFCSRGKRYDGVMPLAEAEMCSTAADKPGILAKLIAAELVENVDGEMLRVVRIDQHIPPPSVRNASAESAVRVARHRKHKNGDHSGCLPDKCEKATGNGPVDRGNALHQDGDRTGQDGGPTPVNEISDDEPPWRDDDPDYAHLNEAS